MFDILSFLSKKYPDAHNLIALNNGAWSAAYKFSTGEGDLVARVSDTDLNFKKDKWAFEIVEDYLPVPEIFSIDYEKENYICISEFVQGVHFETLDATGLKPIKNAIINLFEGLHSIDVRKVSGYGDLDTNLNGSCKSWKEYMLAVASDHDQKCNLIHGWRENIRQSASFLKQFDELFLELKRLLEYLPEIKYLVHSDLLNFNVLTDKNKISAVLDWGSCLIGDYLYDLAWFEFYEPWYPEFAKINLLEEIRLRVFKFDSSQYKAERLLAYKLHIALGSMAYNSYRKDWQEFRKAYNRTKSMRSK